MAWRDRRTLLASTLSYLGYGVQRPARTWGNMLQNAQGEMYQAPYSRSVLA